MQAADYDGFVDAWTQAWDLYGKRVSPGAIDLSFNALQRYDLQAITRALTAHVNDPDTGQFPPKPADIVRLIDGRKEDRADTAWTKVENTIRRVGQYDNIVFDDPIIHAVIRDMGGWIDLCLVAEKELPFKAREFVKRYQGYLIQGGAGEYPRQLIGRNEQVNHAAGFANNASPVLIGDQGRASQVYRGGNDLPAVAHSRLGDEGMKLLRQLAGTDAA